MPSRVGVAYPCPKDRAALYGCYPLSVPGDRAVRLADTTNPRVSRSSVRVSDFKGKHAWLWAPCRKPLLIKGRFYGCYK